MSPVLLNPSSYEKIKAHGLPEIVENTLATARIGSPLQLLRYSGGSESAPQVDEEYLTRLNDLLEFSPDARRLATFALSNAQVISPLLVPDTKCLDEELQRSVVGYAMYEAPTRMNLVSAGWRSGFRFTAMTCNTHGDVSVLQTDFAKEQSVITTDIVDAKFAGFSLPQDTSLLLIAALHYARAVGAFEIPEIQNFKEWIERVRNHPMGNPSYCTESSKFEPDISCALESRLIGDPACDASSYLIFRTSGGTYLPRISKDRELEFLKIDPNGPITVPELSHWRFSPSILFTQTELPDLFLGIYKTFARSPNLMAQILHHTVSNKR